MTQASRAKWILLFLFGPLADADNAQILQSYANDPFSVSEVVYLVPDEQNSAALYIEQFTANPQGMAIFIHQPGGLMDWPQALKVSRQRLPDKGWSTLSLNIAAQAESADLQALLSRALVYANSRGVFNIAFICEGEQITEVIKFMTTQVSSEDNQGYGLILLNAEHGNDRAMLGALASLTIPIFDLHQPSPHAQKLQQLRQAAVRRTSNSDYTTATLSESPDENYATEADESFRRIWGWLKSNLSGSQATVKVNQ